MLVSLTTRRAAASVGLLCLEAATRVGQHGDRTLRHGRGEGNVPKEIAVDAADSPHLADLGPQANDLDPHMCSLLNDNVGIVGELRRGSTGIILDFVGHQLQRLLVTGWS